MKLPRRPLTRVLALTTTALVVVGAGAVADTVPVTLGVVNGARHLVVTGSDGNVPAGAAQLSFGSNDATSPFGVVVTDAAYERSGYSVSATLSDLYKLQPSGTVDCDADAVPAGAFSVSFDDRPQVTDGLEAVVEPYLTFTDTSLNEDLTGVLGLDLSLLGITDTLTVTVTDLAGFLQTLDASALTLMDVTDGAGGAFEVAAEHPGCVGSGAGTPTGVGLQRGATATPSLSGLTSDLFTDADADGSGAVDAGETIASGLLPTGADTQGGTLWDATRNALTVTLDDAGLLSLLSDQDLVDLTTAVVDDLLADATDLTLDLAGQSGIYPNLPVLELDADGIGDASTGLYHGVMTVTLLDQ